MVALTHANPVICPVIDRGIIISVMAMLPSGRDTAAKHLTGTAAPVAVITARQLAQAAVLTAVAIGLRSRRRGDVFSPSTAFS